MLTDDEIPRILVHKRLDYSERAALEQAERGLWIDNLQLLSRIHRGRRLSEHLWSAGEEAARLHQQQPTLIEVLDGNCAYSVKRPAGHGVLQWCVTPAYRSGLTPCVRALIVAEYLFDDRSSQYEFLDVASGSRQRVTRLEGHLRRYGARIRGIPAANVPYELELAQRYCDDPRHNIPMLLPLMEARIPAIPVVTRGVAAQDAAAYIAAQDAAVYAAAQPAHICNATQGA